jgi:O-antigen/teichoic acid export membrane protein
LSDPGPGAPAASAPGGDIAALAKGGRTNLVGFLLRLVARMPFLLLGGRLYGAAELGRFASALVVVELVALVCAIGEKRGLAQRLSEGKGREAHLVVDGMAVALILSLLAAAFLWLVPAPLFPSGAYSQLDRLIVLAIPAYALTEIALAAQAYRFDIKSTVRARAIVEPWTISILAGLFWLIEPIRDSGLALAYLASIYAGLAAALVPFARTYGIPRGYALSLSRMARLTWRALPLAAADAIEWGTRRLDLLILGLFASPAAVGVYYVAQQVASLPQKLKTSFEPILGPVLTRKLKEHDFHSIARQVCQVGFWITAAQAGVALALGIPGEAIMGLAGPNFVGGTGALALLLAAEVAAATAVVAESALIYVARMRNLWISLATIALQAALTVAAMLAADAWGLNDFHRASLVAGALLVALACSSLAKALLLSSILGETVNNWRWTLLWAAAAAILLGQLLILLPEWAELVFGVPAILGVYGWVVWTKGFGPEDRVLFRRQVTPGDEANGAPAEARG